MEVNFRNGFTLRYNGSFEKCFALRYNSQTCEHCIMNVLQKYSDHRMKALEH
jgi:hypothetical protein